MICKKLFEWIYHPSQAQRNNWCVAFTGLWQASSRSRDARDYCFPDCDWSVHTHHGLSLVQSYQSWTLIGSYCFLNRASYLEGLQRAYLDIYTFFALYYVISLALEIYFKLLDPWLLTWEKIRLYTLSIIKECLDLCYKI